LVESNTPSVDVVRAHDLERARTAELGGNDFYLNDLAGIALVTFRPR